MSEPLTNDTDLVLFGTFHLGSKPSEEVGGSTIVIASNKYGRLIIAHAGVRTNMGLAMLLRLVLLRFLTQFDAGGVIVISDEDWTNAFKSGAARWDDKLMLYVSELDALPHMPVDGTWTGQVASRFCFGVVRFVSACAFLSFLSCSLSLSLSLSLPLFLSLCDKKVS